MEDMRNYILLSELIQRELDGVLSDEQVASLHEMLTKDPEAFEYYIETILTISLLHEPQGSCIELNNSLKFSENPEDSQFDGDLPMDSNVSLEGVDIQDVLSDKKEAAVAGYDDSADRAAKEAMHQLADCEENAVAVEIPKEQPQQELIQKVEHIKIERNVSKTSRTIGLLSVAAMLLLIIIIRFLPSNAPKPVASFVRGFNTRWSNSDELMEDGARLWNDGQWYCLDQGLAEIVFDSGAKVLIEAPSEFQVLNENEMDLEGTLTAEVPNSAHGFTVNTGNSKVVDLGTEFGIKTSDVNGTEVHVKKGKIEIAEMVSGRKNPLFTLVESGQGCRVSLSGKLSKVSFKKNKFCWDASNPYEQAVQKTKPLYYWRFDWDRDGLLRDEIDSSLNNEYKLFGSLVYSDGPDLGSGKNVALRLTGRQEDYAVLRGCTNEADNADSFTIITWVRPEKADSASKNNIIMRLRRTSGKFRGRGRSLGLDDKNQFWFYFTLMDEQAESQGQRAVRSNPVSINTWHHVAITYTKNNQINLYVDGRLQASERIVGTISLATKDMQWCVGAAYSETRTSFEGTIDEICHYDRELSAEEVRMLSRKKQGF